MNIPLVFELGEGSDAYFFIFLFLARTSRARRLLAMNGVRSAITRMRITSILPSDILVVEAITTQFQSVEVERDSVILSVTQRLRHRPSSRKEKNSPGSSSPYPRLVNCSSPSLSSTLLHPFPHPLLTVATIPRPSCAESSRATSALSVLALTQCSRPAPPSRGE